MQWRVLVRRCPARSLTVVGDVAQTGAPAGTTTWATTLDAIAQDRWRIEHLTVNYRTPRLIVDYAERAVRGLGLDVPGQRTMREGDREVEVVRFADVDQLSALVVSERDRVGDGRLAVISVEGDGPWAASALRRSLESVLGEVVGGDADDALDHQVAVLDATASKGLEVDAVVVVDPDAIVDSGGTRGPSDLFVAMTRATQSLVIAQPEGTR
jgi:DNA helicase IV